MVQINPNPGPIPVRMACFHLRPMWLSSWAWSMNQEVMVWCQIRAHTWISGWIPGVWFAGSCQTIILSHWCFSLSVSFSFLLWNQEKYIYLKKIVLRRADDTLWSDQNTFIPTEHLKVCALLMCPISLSYLIIYYNFYCTTLKINLWYLKGSTGFQILFFKDNLRHRAAWKMLPRPSRVYLGQPGAFLLAKLLQLLHETQTKIWFSIWGQSVKWSIFNEGLLCG